MKKNTYLVPLMLSPGSICEKGDMVFAFRELVLFTEDVGHLCVEELIFRAETKCCINDLRYML